MNFSEFLGWLSGCPLEDKDLPKLLEQVGDVLDSLEEADPRYAWMAAIEDKLLDGSIPRERLRALADRFPDNNWEQRLRMAATVAPRAHWDNETLAHLRYTLQSFESDPSPLMELLTQLEEELEEFWNEFMQEFEPPTSSLEAAGSALLQQSYQDWRLALEALRRGDFDRGLEAASGANRLLSVLARVEEHR